MENETEVIVEAPEVDDVESEQTEDTEDTTTTVEEKPKETPQQRKARLERQLKKVKKELGETDEPISKKSGFDYGEKAFLKASGINGQEEIDLVKTWVERTGDDLDTIVEDEIFQAKLDKLRKNKESKTAIPPSSKRGTQSSTSSVEYWLGKPFSDVPKEMKKAVLNARLAKDSNKTY